MGASPLKEVKMVYNFFGEYVYNEDRHTSTKEARDRAYLTATYSLLEFNLLLFAKKFTTKTHFIVRDFMCTCHIVVEVEDE
jgi:hypothetical protein